MAQRSDEPTSTDVHAALLACLERGDGGARFAKVLAGAVPLGVHLDKKGAQSMLGLGALALGRFEGKRGAADAHRIIEAVLARWDALPTGVGDHVEQFVRNALAVVGPRSSLVGRVAEKIPSAPKDHFILVNHACVFAAAGDDERLLAALERALEAGARPAQIEREPELARIVGEPRIRALLERHAPPRATRRKRTGKDQKATEETKKQGRARPAATEKPDASVSPLRAALAALGELYEKDLDKLGPDAPPRERELLAVRLAPPATTARIEEAEEACKVDLPDDYRAFLMLHDGASFGGRSFQLLGTEDLRGGTKLWESGREFIEMSADYGSAELLECIPIGNLGQPNDWLLYDPRERQYLYCLNADSIAMKTLADAVARKTRVTRNALSA
jgi:hypothetical protein